ncbi:MAG: ABC transporter ATP-binding protein [Leptospiraceae bacterium]|nr:ABC transporter ATP-binding protein [Leptospiraceae bacterium]MCP5495023.1 ABC transporter ATP-binding protein [Leptospiraceae bacterium]
MEKLLQIQDLHINFRVEDKVFPVIQDVSFDINSSEILALVGESGCGKTVTSLAITKLLPIKIAEYVSGKIFLKNQNLLQISNKELKGIRGKFISYIFQDPFTSLNPLKKIKDQVTESYLIHISSNEMEAIERAKFLLNKVGITDLDDRLNAYPNQMSGGMLQRISIAAALMCSPSLLIADEPTSAIDVTIQSQLIDLLLRLKEESRMSILFISHDIGLVASFVDRIGVMYAGQIVEIGTVDEVIDSPKHPYTQALLESVPSDFDAQQKLKVIEGIVPAPNEYPKGCHFSTRCEKVMEKCILNKPKIFGISETHFSRCHLFG